MRNGLDGLQIVLVAAGCVLGALGVAALGCVDERTSDRQAAESDSGSSQPPNGVDASGTDGGRDLPEQTDTTTPDAGPDALGGVTDGGGADARGGGADATDDEEPPELSEHGDVDRDGVLDFDELAEGTDPYDPRSARAWHPEVEGHPRLFIGPGDVDEVAERIGAEEGAHAVLWRRIEGLSEQTVPDQPADGTYDPVVASTQGQIAEALAFRGLLEEDVAAARRAADILAAPFPDPTYLNEQSDFNVGSHYNLHESETLVAMCTAWDWLAASELPDEDKSRAREGLLNRIDTFRELCFGPGGCRALLRNEGNNHTLKVLGALGLCAIALPDRDTAAADFNEAIAGIDYLLNRRQGVPEGGYGENWGYLSYGGQSYLQLLYAWHRHGGGEAWRLQGLGTVTPEDPLAGTTTDYVDFAANSTTRAIFRNLLVAAQPNGLTVPIDDGNPSPANAGLLAALFDDGRFLWNWGQPAVGYATARTTTATFAALDPAMAPVAPDWPLAVFLPEAGFSVWRTSFASDQLYVHISHEAGVVRQAGFAHEHADTLSFVVHAYGEPLVIDPGYIDFSNHLLVKYAQDHNLVLVDGEGPRFNPLDPLLQGAPRGDAFLHESDPDPELTTLIASAKYADAEVRRRFLRVDGRFLVVADALLSEESRAWTWQLNGYGGGTVPNTAFSSAPTGGRWDRPGASVVAALGSTVGTVTFDQRLEDSLNSQGHRQHVCLTGEAEMGEGAGFLAAVVPVEAAAGSPEIALDQPAYGVAVMDVADAGRTDRLVLNLGGSDVLVDGQAVAPGVLWWAELDESGEVMRSRGWTMETPPIPDPEPFL